LSRYIFASKACIDNRRKTFLNRNISSICPYNMANFGPVTAEIGSGVWSTLGNFNGFRVLASLLQRRRATEVIHTLHDVWRSPGLVQYIYIRGFLPPYGILSGAVFTLRPMSCILLHWQRYCTVLQQRAFAKLCGVVGLQGMELRNFRRGRHLYSTGRS